MNLAVLLARARGLYADRPALLRGTVVTHTYVEFAQQVATLAGALRHELHLAPGDRVAIAMANCAELAVVKWACWHAGLCAVPVNAKLHRREFSYILANSGTRVCFTDAKLEETVGGLDEDIPTLQRVISTSDSEWPKLLAAEPVPLSDVAPNDNAWLFYTSGTTGQPKGATLTHRNMLAQTMNFFADVDQVGPANGIIHSAPMTHGGGCYGLPYVAMGGSQIIPESGGFEPSEMLDLIGQHDGGVSFFFAPTMIVRLLAHPALAETDTSNLRTIIYGGGPMYVADLQRGIEMLGQKFVQIYGQGEAPMTITGLTRAMHQDTDHPRYLERLGSVGVARTGVEVKIFDQDDNELPAGEIGEVVLRGDVVMKGYWENPDATANALANGWLHSGDMGSFDADGFLTLKDRSKDMIISGGTNIYPREIEEVLLRHPAVEEVSVVGKPHDDWGEEVIAFVVAKPDAEVGPTALDQICLDNIARFKRPKQYRFVESLPKNNYGKVLKTELRMQLDEEDTQ